MKYVAYYRVSTAKQGESGLGLEAQQKAVENYVSSDLIYKSFTEIETGTNKKNRPILNDAIELCKELDATLVIAKLDRLARSVAFVSSLMDSKVKFVAVDMPHASNLNLHMMSAIAEYEAKIISTRIKDALAVKREILALEGKKLGTPANLTEEARKKGLAAITRKRLNNGNNKRAKSYLAEILKATHPNKLTLQKIADQLNENDFRTSTGKQFTPTQVSRLKAELV